MIRRIFSRTPQRLFTRPIKKDRSLNIRGYLETLESRQLLTTLGPEVYSSEFSLDSGDFNQFSGSDAIKIEENGFLGIDIPRTTIQEGGILDTGLGSYGWEFGANFDARIGLEYSFLLDAGSARGTYEGSLTSTVHDPGDGGPIRIDTASLFGGGRLTTQSPTVEAFADFVFDLDASGIEVKACFVDCGILTVDAINFEETLNLFSVNRDGDGAIKFFGKELDEGIELGNLPIEVSEAEGEQLGLELNILDIVKIGATLPDISLLDEIPDAQGKLEQDTDSGDHERQIAELKLNITEIAQELANLAKIPLPIGTISIGGGPLSAELTMIDYEIGPTLNVNQSVEMTPDMELTYIFSDPLSGVPVAVDVVREGVQLRGVTQVTFKVGDDLTIDPVGTSKVKVSPQLDTDYSFTNDIGLDLDIEGAFKALELNLQAFGEEWSIGPAFEHEHSFDVADLGSIFNETFTVDGTSLNLASFEIGGEVTDLEVVVSDQPSVANAGDTVTYEFKVENKGTIPSENVVVELQLDELLTFEGSNYSCSNGSGVLSCEVGRLEPSQSKTIRVDASVAEVVLNGEAIDSTAEVLGQNSRDPDLQNNQARARTISILPGYFRVLTRGDRTGTDERPFGQKCGTDLCTFSDAVMAASERPGRDIVQPAQVLAGSEVNVTINQHGELVTRSSNTLNPREIRIPIPDTITVSGYEVLCSTPESLQVCDNVDAFDLKSLAPGNYVLRGFKPTPPNASPVIYSNDLHDAEENHSSPFLNVAASDFDGDLVQYRISGGEDSSLFRIDSTTGSLRLAITPDYEAPRDGNQNNIYVVEVTADDGRGGSDTQLIEFLITDQNERPEYVGSHHLSVVENAVHVAGIEAIDPDGDSLSYSIAGGADASLFTIDRSTGELQFRSAPDYENHSSQSGEQNYELSVMVEDGRGGQLVRNYEVLVKDVPEAQNPPLEGTFEYVDGVLRVVGTDGVDRVEFENRAGSIVVSSNFGATEVSMSGLKRVEFLQSRGDELYFSDDLMTNDFKINSTTHGFAEVSFALGVDNVFLEDGVVRIEGTPGNDNITLSQKGTLLQVAFNGIIATYPMSQVDRISVFGNEGRDRVRSTKSLNIPMELYGGEGNDLLVSGSGNDLLDGGGGSDVLNGRGGNDELRGDGDSSRGARDIIYGHDGNDTLLGGPGKDRLVGMAGNDMISGGSDEDAVLGRDGNDMLRGDGGHDIVLGGRGDDSISGGLGNDRLYGQSGNDELKGDEGADRLRGGSGNDRFTVLLMDSVVDMIFGEDGEDSVEGLFDSLDRLKVELDLRN